MLTGLTLEVRVEYEVPEVENIEEGDDSVDELDKGVGNWLVEDDIVEDEVLLNEDDDK